MTAKLRYAVTEYESQTLAVLNSIDTSLQSIAQSLRAQAEAQAQLLQEVKRHLHPGPTRVVAVSRATYAGEEVQEGEIVTQPLGDAGKGDITGRGGVPGFRRR